MASGSALANFKFILISPLVGGDVSFRRSRIRRKIVHDNEETVYIHVVSYLESRVRVVDACAFE